LEDLALPLGSSLFLSASFFSAAAGADFLFAILFLAGFLASSKGAGAGCFFCGFFSTPPLPEAEGLAKKNYENQVVSIVK